MHGHLHGISTALRGLRPGKVVRQRCESGEGQHGRAECGRWPLPSTQSVVSPWTCTAGGG